MIKSQANNIKIRNYKVSQSSTFEKLASSSHIFENSDLVGAAAAIQMPSHLNDQCKSPKKNGPASGNESIKNVAKLLPLPQDVKVAKEVDPQAASITRNLTEYQIRQELYKRIEEAYIATAAHFNSAGIENCFSIKDQLLGTTLEKKWMKEMINEIPKGRNPEEEVPKHSINSISKDFRGCIIDSSGARAPVALLINAVQGAHQIKGDWLQESRNIIRCQACDSAGQRIGFLSGIKDLKDHFMSDHQQIGCTDCGHLFNNRMALSRHNVKVHPASVVEHPGQEIKKRKDKLSEKSKASQIKANETFNCESPTCAASFGTRLERSFHKVLSHGDFSQEKLKFLVFSSLDAVPQCLIDQQQSLLKAEAILGQPAISPRFCQGLSGQPVHHLVMLYEGEIRVVLSYHIWKTLFQRKCLVYNAWCSGKFNLDLGLALQHLLAAMEVRRVTEIAVSISNDFRWYYGALQYFRTFNKDIIDTIKELRGGEESPLVVSIKTAVCLTDHIPRTTTPQIDSKSPAAETASYFIGACKTFQVDAYIKALFLKQLRELSDESDKKAKKSDQALTEDQVFEKIFSKTLIQREQLFDVCKFAPDWNIETHYNALTEPWPGNFIFCNPPFSLGYLFLGKAMEQYLNGKNIIMILPQISTQSGAPKRLLHLLGTIHDVGMIRFWPHKSCNLKPCSIIYLLQPDHLNFLRDFHRRGPLGMQDDGRAMLRDLDAGKSKRAEKIEVALRLLSLGVPVKEVQKVVNLYLSHYEDFNAGALAAFKNKHELHTV